MRQLLVDGVPTFHTDGPQRTTAVLWFGVGMQDETFTTAGISHVVEHLALAEQPKSHLDIDGTVDVDTTRFSATGRPEQVAAFLQRLAGTLADLPTHHLAREVSVIGVEDGYGADPSMASAWTARFGLTGPGLVSMRGHGAETFTEAMVAEHARRWFTAGNAALAVVGPWPQGLSLPLRPGPRPPRKAAVPLPRPDLGPQWVQSSSPGPALLLDRPVPDEAVGSVAATVLAERLEDVARHELGLSYSVSSDVMCVGDSDVLTFSLDAAEGRAGDVAAVVWEQLSALAAEGPTDAELGHALAGYADRTDPGDDDVARGEPVRAASTTVLGARWRPLEEIAAGFAAVTAGQVREFLHRARATALVVVPDGSRLPEGTSGIGERQWCASTDALPQGRVHRPPALTRLLKRDARQQLAVGERALGVRYADGDTCVIAWDEVATAVPYDDDGVLVMGVNRCSVAVHPAMYGRAAFVEVCDRLGQHLEDLRRARAAAVVPAATQTAASTEWSPSVVRRTASRPS